LRKHKHWFSEGCSELLDQRKGTKLQCLQDPSKINGDNLNNIRCKASRHCRNKKGKYLKDKLATAVRTRTSETFIEKQMDLSGTISLERI
jgi:hypothetical protein